MKLSRPAAASLFGLLASCATAPPPAPAPVTFEQKMGWILRLEDQRVLRDPPPPAPVVSPGGRGSAAAVPSPDLIRLLSDGEARVRRRAALAIGRVGLPDGAAPLIEMLAGDPEIEVRQMAAFALGLLRASDAVEPLRAALAEGAPPVQGRAAEALGRIGDAASAGAIGDMIAAHVAAGALNGVAPDELGYPLAPEVEAVRLGIYALARLKAWAPLASALVDPAGAPVTRWWPLAYAARRVEDPQAVPALRHLVEGEGTYTRAFAARGLGIVKDAGSLDVLVALTGEVARHPAPAVEAVRSLADLADPRTLAPLIEVLKVRGVHPGIRAEAVRAIGALETPESTEVLLDLLSDRVPEIRAEALAALARTDHALFLSALSGMDLDRHWTVRAALATALAGLPVATAAPLLEPLIEDEDQRVRPAVLAALAKRQTPKAAAIAFEQLKADDPMVRAAAARALGELKPEGAAPALVEAARFAVRDSAYDARTAALEALAGFGADVAEPALTAALADKDWAVRVRAADLLRDLGDTRDLASIIRPAPTRAGAPIWEAPGVVAPPVSTHLYIDTDRGTIQVELAVLDAPLTVHAFGELARHGYFGGVPVHRVVSNFVIQDGDPRGDGTGGPGYTMRDEINQRPYLRGTVGMALDWADTGGSQFFITHSPQPHLDGRYTVFGQVVTGLEVVDALEEGDLVRGIRVWDGTR